MTDPVALLRHIEHAINRIEHDTEKGEKEFLSAVVTEMLSDVSSS